MAETSSFNKRVSSSQYPSMHERSNVGDPDLGLINSQEKLKSRRRLGRSWGTLEIRTKQG